MSPFIVQNSLFSAEYLAKIAIFSPFLGSFLDESQVLLVGIWIYFFPLKAESQIKNVILVCTP